MLGVLRGISLRNILLYKHLYLFHALVVASFVPLTLLFPAWSGALALGALSMMVAGLQQVMVSGMVRDRASRFKLSFRVMGMGGGEYALAQFASLTAINWAYMTAGVLVFYGAGLALRKPLPAAALLAALGFAPLLAAAGVAFSMLQSFFYSQPDVAKFMTNLVASTLLYAALGVEASGALAWSRRLRWVNPFHPLIIEAKREAHIFLLPAAGTRRESALILLGHALVLLALAAYLEYVWPRDGGLARSPLSLLRPRRRHAGGPFAEGLRGEEDAGALRVSQLWKSFGRKAAVADLSCTFVPGRLYALLGHNGAGKSTLINILTGLHAPDRGTATLDGRPLLAALAEGGVSVGLCTGDELLADNISVRAHLRIAALLKGLDNGGAHARLMIARLGLAEHAGKNVSALSGGTRRKLALGMALMGAPRLLFLDEPTSALDPLSRQEVWALLEELRRTTPRLITLLSTHHLEEAERLADDILVLAAGRVAAAGPTEQIKREFGGGYTVELLPGSGADELLALLREEFPQLGFRAQEAAIVGRAAGGDARELAALLARLRLAVPLDCRLSLNANTLERAYLRIEEDRQEPPPALPADFFARLAPRAPPSSAHRVLHLARQTLVLSLSQPLLVVRVALIYALVLGALKLALWAAARFDELSAFKLLVCFGIQGSFELAVDVWALQLITDRVREVTAGLYVMGVSPLEYHLGKLLAHAATYLLITAGFCGFYLSQLRTRAEAAAVALLLFKFFAWRTALCTQNYIVSRLFVTEQSALRFFHLPQYAMFGAANALSRAVRALSARGASLPYYATALTAGWPVLADQQIGYLQTALIFAAHTAINVGALSWWDERRLCRNFGVSGGPAAPAAAAPDYFAATVAQEEESVAADPTLALRAFRAVKRFGSATAVKSVSFGAAAGASFGLVGQNGAGKSTLFRLLLGQLAKTSGDFSVAGPAPRLPFRRARVGVCFQQDALWPALSVRRHLDFFCALLGVERASLRELLRYFDFEEFMDAAAGELSAGNKRRLCIIIALLRAPEALFLDEATAGVDTAMRQRLKQVLACLQRDQRTTALHTTHFLKDIESFCEKIGFMCHGQFVCVHALAQLKAELGEYSARVFPAAAGPAAVAEALRGSCRPEEPGALHADGSFTVVLRAVQAPLEVFGALAALQERGAVAHFTLNQLSLEDIYVRLMNAVSRPPPVKLG